nr:hypothetical protein [Cupriavidus taiwanensis]
MLSRFGNKSTSTVREIISVGGKGLFEAYAKVLRASHIDFAVVADLDYIEQVGSKKIKDLFKTDSREIKVDVLENVKSMDGDALVRAMEQALSTGSWEHARDVWNYVKSRRRRLRTDLSEDAAALLQEFLQSKRDEQIFILSRGALEEYLPVGNKGKDLEKLIAFLATDDFWLQLPEEGRAELESMAKCLLRE